MFVRSAPFAYITKWEAKISISEYSVDDFAEPTQLRRFGEQIKINTAARVHYNFFIISVSLLNVFHN